MYEYGMIVGKRQLNIWDIHYHDDGVYAIAWGDKDGNVHRADGYCNANIQGQDGHHADGACKTFWEWEWWKY